jgi:hypothetical protein
MLKNKITLFLVFAMVIGVCITAFFAVFKGEAQSQQNANRKEIKVRQIQKEKEKLFDATPIQEGMMPAKQKKHSKIFKGYKNRPKLRNLMAEKEDVEVRHEVGNVRVPVNFNLNSFLRNLSCKADAVVIGMVKSKASQINEDGTFVFTDYEFSVNEVLKNNSAASVNPNTEITVTRTGGAVKLNGRTARAIDYREVPLIVDENYLLFLKFIPETGAYKSLSNSRDEDSFQILGDRKIQQVSMVPLPLSGRRITDLLPFMTEVRIALNGVCENEGGVE